MRNYTLIAYKGGNYLLPREAFKTEEYLSEHEPRFLSEYHVKGSGSKSFRRYRFCTCEPTRFSDTLEYDIRCPHCQDTLRLCGLPIDSLTHGLYKCRRCDEETERRG